VTDPDELICLGAVAGAWGVRGEVRLKSFCAAPEAIADYAPLVTEDGRSFGVTIVRPLQGAFAARLTGVATREAAEALKGQRLHAPRGRLPALPDDEFYHADLIGLDVLDAGGAPVGRVRAVHDHGAGDLIEIDRPGRGTVLIPFTRTAVPTVDLAARRLIVDPPPGLIEPGEGGGDG
jgi:16S rRNA processing protein RimM